MSITNSISIKVVAGFVGIALALGLAFAFAAPAKAATVEELQAQITQLLSLISSLQAQLANLGGGGGGAAKCAFTRDLTIGVRGDDVTCLQNYLTGTGHFTYSGGSTGYFGPITQSAVAAWQAANNVNPPAGYFGPISKAKYDALVAAAPAPAPSPTPTPGTPPPAPTGTGLSVAAAAQPAATLAPYNAARVPFTKFTLTAGSDGAVLVDSITVERQGLAADANFASLSLLDENGIQVGNTKTLNSNHQAIFSQDITIPAGTTKTFTVAGNIAAAASVNSGEVASIAVVAVNTPATLSGALPIVGASHTMNNTLAIGTVTVARSPLDPNGAVTKNIGTTAYTFSGLRVTAGSAEKVRLWSVTWNQGSSSSAADLDNVKVKVGDTEYSTTANGDDYTAQFPGGILIDKGGNVDVSVKADIIGGSSRTITFNIDDTTDLYLTGEQYKYGITPPTSGTGIAPGNIWFAGSTVTVSQGTLSFSQDTSVASQNVAINLANQPLAGFKTDVKGEPISVAQIVFDIGTTTGEWGESANLTDVSIVDENGAVVAGPVDASAAAASQLTFTDTVTFPEGIHSYQVKGKLGTGVANDGTFQLTTNPASDWTTVTGDNTGDTVTPSPSGDQSLQTMTAKTAAVTLSVSNTPAAQTVVAGVQSFVFANYQLDATASGEDVRFNNLPLAYDTTGTATDLTKCQLWDGSTALNTGSNIVDPSAVSSSTTFTFDTGLIVSKGTIKTLALKCNMKTGVTSIYFWGMDSGQSPSGTGQTSGQSATITVNDSVGQYITATANGTLLVSLDSSSPSYGIAAANTTGNTLAVLRVEAQNEEINLTRVALQLTNTASSSASDLTKVSLWDGSTQVGEAIFTGTNTLATSTLTSTVTIPKDGHKLITVKGDFSEIGTGKPGVQGHFVAVDYDGDATIGTRGIGTGSGATINQGSSSDTAVTGVRVFRSYPIFTKLAVPSNTLGNGEKILARWKVGAASAGDIGISKFTLLLSTTTATVTGLNVYCYTDSGFTNVCTGLSTDGGLLVTDKLASGNQNWASSATQIDFAAEDSSSASTTVQVPAGGARYFEVRGTIGSSASGASVSTQVEGDAGALDNAVSTPANWFVLAAPVINGTDTHDDFIWSANATTTSTVNHSDWSNGYGVEGLPGSNMSAEVLSQ